MNEGENVPLWTWKPRCKHKDFVSRNGFCAEDKGSHSAKVQVLPVPFFSFSNQLCLNAWAPLLHGSWRDRRGGKQGCDPSEYHWTSEETQTELAAFMFCQAPLPCSAGFPICPAMFTSCLKWFPGRQGGAWGPAQLRVPATGCTAKELAHQLPVVLGNQAPTSV